MQVIAKHPTGPAFPYSLADLRRDLERGRVTRDWIARKTNESEWYPVGALLGLESLVPISAATAPPSSAGAQTNSQRGAERLALGVLLAVGAAASFWYAYHLISNPKATITAPDGQVIYQSPRQYVDMLEQLSPSVSGLRQEHQRARADYEQRQGLSVLFFTLAAGLSIGAVLTVVRRARPAGSAPPTKPPGAHPSASPGDASRP